MKTNKLFSIGIISTAIIALSACSQNEKPANGNEAAPKTEVKETVASENTGDGATIYKKNCVACHQANGEGMVNAFPPLAKSDFIVNKEAVIEQVIKGRSGEMVVNGVKYNSAMPPQNLSDEEIAAVLSYVYSSWGNSGGAVTTEEVKAVRGKI